MSLEKFFYYTICALRSTYGQHDQIVVKVGEGQLGECKPTSILRKKNYPNLGTCILVYTHWKQGTVDVNKYIYNKM